MSFSPFCRWGVMSFRPRRRQPITFRPRGDYSNSGVSSATAFSTLGKARDAIRRFAPIRPTILWSKSPRRLSGDDTIAFTDQDLGTNGFNVIHKNQDEVGRAYLIGSTRITGWTPYKDNIYQAHIGSGLDFTTLYEIGIPAELARWPKLTSPFATSRGGYMTFTDKRERP
jgi:hypothetical protein